MYVFTRVLIFDCGMFKLLSFFSGVFVCGSSHPGCDDNERVDFPFVILCKKNLAKVSICHVV